MSNRDEWADDLTVEIPLSLFRNELSPLMDGLYESAVGQLKKQRAFSGDPLSKILQDALYPLILSAVVMAKSRIEHNYFEEKFGRKAEELIAEEGPGRDRELMRLAVTKVLRSAKAYAVKDAVISQIIFAVSEEMQRLTEPLVETAINQSGRADFDSAGEIRARLKRALIDLDTEERHYWDSQDRPDLHVLQCSVQTSEGITHEQVQEVWPGYNRDAARAYHLGG